MTETEHLLTCLMEECGEVQHAVAKALRFGLDHAPDGKIMDNATYITFELVDVLAGRELLEQRGILPVQDESLIRKLIDAKKAKVLKHIALAREQGTVT